MRGMHRDFCCDFNMSNPDLLMGKGFQNNVIGNKIARQDGVRVDSCIREPKMIAVTGLIDIYMEKDER